MLQDEQCCLIRKSFLSPWAHVVCEGLVSCKVSLNTSGIRKHAPLLSHLIMPPSNSPAILHPDAIFVTPAGGGRVVVTPTVILVVTVLVLGLLVVLVFLVVIVVVTTLGDVDVVAVVVRVVVTGTVVCTVVVCVVIRVVVLSE